MSSLRFPLGYDFDWKFPSCLNLPPWEKSRLKSRTSFVQTSSTLSSLQTIQPTLFRPDVSSVFFLYLEVPRPFGPTSRSCVSFRPVRHPQYPNLVRHSHTSPPLFFGTLPSVSRIRPGYSSDCLKRKTHTPTCSVVTYKNVWVCRPDVVLGLSRLLGFVLSVLTFLFGEGRHYTEVTGDNCFELYHDTNFSLQISLVR